MPPPHLHPRSRMTSSLFATTVVASFFVVALPHVLPCPAPRVTYADGEMPSDSSSAAAAKRRRRRKMDGAAAAESRDGIVQFDTVLEEDADLRRSRRTRRECPVPKPGGVVGELLKLHRTKAEDGRPPDQER